MLLDDYTGDADRYNYHGGSTWGNFTPGLHAGWGNGSFFGFRGNGIGSGDLREDKWGSDFPTSTLFKPFKIKG